MNHRWTSSLPSSTYFYWMQGSPESQAPTLKLVFVPWLQSLIFFFFILFFTAVSVSLLFQQRIIGMLLCALPPQRKASSWGHSPHSTNWLLICQMHFKVEWKSRPLFEVICEDDTPTCIAVVTHPSFALDSWPLLMQRKLCCSTGSSAPLRHLKRRWDNGGVLACTPWFFQRSLNPASPRDLHGEHLSWPLIHTANTSRKVALTEPIEGKDFF